MFRVLPLLFVLAQPAHDVLAQEMSPAMRFRQLRAEGVAAAGADDMATAAARLAAADAVVPNHPGLIGLRARVAAASGQSQEALALWRRYAELGLAANPSRDPLNADMLALPAWSEVAERLEANRRSVGTLIPVAILEQPLAIENVVHDATRNRLLVSTIAGRTILQIDPQGAVSPWLSSEAPVAGVLGLAMDSERGLLWAASAGLAAATPDAADPMRDSTELLKIDLVSGRVLDRYSPPDAPQRSLGDVAVGPDGAVYVSDSLAGDVWRLRPSGDSLERLVPAGVVGSPQGMALSADGTALILADYGSGLHRIELSTGQVTMMPAPTDASLIGLDAVLRRGDRLVVVQNGAAPRRILELTLSADQSAVTKARVLAANLDAMTDPAGGSLDEGTLLFVSVSQLGAYGDDGGLPNGPPPPARISRLMLDQ